MLLVWERKWGEKRCVRDGYCMINESIRKLTPSLIVEPRSCLFPREIYAALTSFAGKYGWTYGCTFVMAVSTYGRTFVMAVSTYGCTELE